MDPNTKDWLRRADDILKSGPSGFADTALEAVHCATSMLSALYGPNSSQVKIFLAQNEMLSKTKSGTGSIIYDQSANALCAIKNAKAELQAGLVTGVRVLVAGEILAELVRLAKETMGDKGEAAKNVAAVLAAAAFEDLIRRMGENLAGVTGRPELQEIITALKSADILKGGQVGTAQSYLKFRNDSLHADWEEVDRSQVQSCLAFVEELLLKHFS